MLFLVTQLALLLCKYDVFYFPKNGLEKMVRKERGSLPWHVGVAT
jgi:hypothetical protein